MTYFILNPPSSLIKSGYLGLILALGTFGSFAQESSLNSYPGAVLTVPDPNFPGKSGNVVGVVSWSYRSESTIPDVYFEGTLTSNIGHTAIYLGFNEQGSWLEHPDLPKTIPTPGDEFTYRPDSGPKVYIWNYHTRKLVKVADYWEDVPRQIAHNLQNQNQNPQYMRINQKMRYPYMKEHPVKSEDGNISLTQQSDPNLPGLVGGGSKFIWTYTRPLGEGQPPAGMILPNKPIFYLGYNEKGSWFHDGENGLFLWSPTTQTIEEVRAPFTAEQTPIYYLDPVTHTTKAQTRGGMQLVPLNLSNPSNDMLRWEAEHREVSALQPEPNNKKPIAISENTGGQSQKTVAIPLHGYGGSVTNGILTFTINDPQNPENGQQKSFKVTRPGIAAGLAVQGDTGTWVHQDGDQVLLFMIQGDHTVSGNVVPPMMVPMFLPPK